MGAIYKDAEDFGYSKLHAKRTCGTLYILVNEYNSINSSILPGLVDAIFRRSHW